MDNTVVKKFRIQFMNVSLTYPQCNMPVPLMREAIKNICGLYYGWDVTCAEDHEERENDTNVGVHRHVALNLCKKPDWSSPTKFDLKWDNKTFHPHIEPAKNMPNWVKYCIKDGVYECGGMLKDVPFDLEIYLESHMKKSGYSATYLAKELIAGKTLDELVDIVPGQVYLHKRKMEEFSQFLLEKKQRQLVRPKFLGFKEPTQSEYAWTTVQQWANDNFMKPREPRQPQLWLWSRAPHLGKTYPWAITLEKYFKLYEWQEGGKQGKAVLDCDYILIDELKGQLTITELKRLSQMYGMSIDIKYGNITRWNKNVPLIITSNLPPREIFHKCKSEDIESLIDRFLVIEVEDVCKLIPIEPEPVPILNPLSSPPRILVPGTPIIPSQSPGSLIDDIIWDPLADLHIPMDESDDSDSQPSYESIKRKLKKKHPRLFCDEDLNEDF
nr:MAG: replication associated protein [Cressdnaviricota sp.]